MEFQMMKSLKARSKSKKLIHNKCPSGYVKRKGYTRKNTGKHIKAICIRSTSPYSSKPRTHRKSRKACPPGKSPRAAYTRQVTKANGSRETIRVKSACVKGSASKVPANQRIGPLRKGELQRFGYSYKLPESIRHSSLRAAIKQLGALDVYRKLDAVAKLSATANPQSSRAFATDRDWIRSHYVLKAF
jgi:hypothetical protein